MRTAPVAPKFVTWLVLLFGLAEVPWVIFLLFNQQTTVEANHLRFASLGLGLAAAALCGGAAWSIWTRRRSAATLCSAATTSTLIPYFHNGTSWTIGTAQNLTLSGLEEMHAVFGVKAGPTAAAETLQVDYLKIVQLR